LRRPRHLGVFLNGVDRVPHRIAEILQGYFVGEGWFDLTRTKEIGGVRQGHDVNVSALLSEVLQGLATAA
jgi:hypothetical protein